MCYPYEANVGRCRAKKNDNLRTMSCNVPEERPLDGLYKMGPAYSLNNETDIMLEIFHYGPVQGMQISNLFRRSSNFSLVQLLCGCIPTSSSTAMESTVTRLMEV